MKNGLKIGMFCGLLLFAALLCACMTQNGTETPVAETVEMTAEAVVLLETPLSRTPIPTPTGFSAFWKP